MSWDTAFEENGGSNTEKMEFVKFPEGITRLRVIGTAPHTRWTHWMPQFKRSVNCPGQGCPICNLIKDAKANGETSRYNTQKKFAILAINRETGKVEILDQGKQFFEDLREVRGDNLAAHGEMSNYDIKVKRRGTTKDDTTYRVDFLEASPLSSDDEKLAKNAPSLDEYFQPHPREAIVRILNGEAFDEVMKDVFKKDDASSPSLAKEEFSVE